MKHITVLTGAGVSAESGLSTFRDTGGLWENHSIDEVATPEAFERNPLLVLDFYNQRRQALKKVEPNAAHIALKELENYFDVQIITQNVDDLHERAGSTNVLHLHGMLTQARSSINSNVIEQIGYRDIKWGDCAQDGSQLRPHIVWFGEPVPLIEKAAKIIEKTDILIVVGSSLSVYPAAALVHALRPDKELFLIDNKEVQVNIDYYNYTFIKQNATEGMKQLKKKLVEAYI